MGEFDKTKKAIGLNNLDDSSRKNMLEKFKSAGGKIVDDKKAKEEQAKKNRPEPKVRQGTVSRTEFDRSSGKGSSSRSSSQRSSSSRSESKTSPKTNLDVQAAYEKELSSFGNRFSIKLKCWFARVTPFRSREVTPQAMGIFAREMKAALMEFKLAGNELLTNSSHSPKITSALDKVNPMLIEILALGHKLYKDTEVTEFLEPYHVAPDSAVALERIHSPLFSIFKKLYILYPYQETYRKGVSLAYEHLQRLEGKPAVIYNTRKKKILQELDNLFGTIFEKLYLLVIRYEDKNIPMISRYMESLLGITQEEKPGHRHAGEGIPEQDQGDSEEKGSEEEEKKDSEEEKKEEVAISKEMNYGLRLMQMYKIDQLRKKFDPRNEYSNMPDSDKALLTFLYFKEFDDNYSFVMTTKKIDIKQVHVNGVRVDYRQKLLDLYETARGVLDQMRIYVDTFKEYSDHKENPGSNYIEASKKTTALDTKRSQHSRNVRVVTKEFMEKSRDLLLIFINDMKSKQEIVGNMDEIISFDAVEAKKRLNKKPIKQCIMESYCYTLALAERLDNGDLYGGVVELSPEEMKESFGVDILDKEKSNEEKSKKIDETLEESISLPDPTETQASTSNPDAMDSDSFDVEY